MSDIPGTHPSVDEGLKTAHYGHGESSSERAMGTASFGKGSSVVGQPDSQDVGGMKGYGEVTSGQKGHPGTD